MCVKSSFESSFKLWSALFRFRINDENYDTYGMEAPLKRFSNSRKIVQANTGKKNERKKTQMTESTKVDRNTIHRQRLGELMILPTANESR